MSTVEAHLLIDNYDSDYSIVSMTISREDLKKLRSLIKQVKRMQEQGNGWWIPKNLSVTSPFSTRVMGTFIVSSVAQITADAVSIDYWSDDALGTLSIELSLRDLDTMSCQGQLLDSRVQTSDWDSGADWLSRVQDPVADGILKVLVKERPEVQALQGRGF